MIEFKFLTSNLKRKALSFIIHNTPYLKVVAITRFVYASLY